MQLFVGSGDRLLSWTFRLTLIRCPTVTVMLPSALCPFSPVQPTLSLVSISLSPQMAQFECDINFLGGLGYLRLRSFLRCGTLVTKYQTVLGKPGRSVTWAGTQLSLLPGDFPHCPFLALSTSCLDACPPGHITDTRADGACSHHNRHLSAWAWLPLE